MDQQNNYKFPLASLNLLFFMWGFITVLNDIMIPHLKSLFDLNYIEAMLIQFCFFLAYGVISIPSGKVVQYFGYKKGVVGALFVVAAGCLIFLPSASMKSYPLFLLGFFVLASGIVLLQVAANPYVALLGSASTASSRLNLAQAFNALGTTVGPLIGAHLILSLVSNPQIRETAGIEILYAILAGILLLLALGFSLIALPKIDETDCERVCHPINREVGMPEKIHPSKTIKTAWIYPHLILGSLAIFFYVGGEVSIGSFLVSFLTEPDIGAMTQIEAGRSVSFYWGGAMIGRFIGFMLLLKVASRTLLAINSVINMILILIVVLSSGSVAVYAVLSIGLFNSIMFPTIFTLSIAGLDKFSPQGSGILCTAIVGGAIMPIFQGWLTDFIGIHPAFIVPFFCYLYILFFALKGSVAYCRLPKE